MKPKLTIVTGNNMKFIELSAELSKFFDCEQGIIDAFEIQGTPEEILQHKLKTAFEKFKSPVLVDDVSTYIDALNGFPGPYMKDFQSCLTQYEIGVKFTNSKIKVVCWLGLCRALGDSIVATGELHGTIVVPKEKEHTEKWFDFFFQADGTDKTLDQYSIEEKNKFSHRGNAMRDLLKKLEL